MFSPFVSNFNSFVFLLFSLYLFLFFSLAPSYCLSFTFVLNSFNFFFLFYSILLSFDFSFFFLFYSLYFILSSILSFPFSTISFPSLSFSSLSLLSPSLPQNQETVKEKPSIRKTLHTYTKESFLKGKAQYS